MSGRTDPAPYKCVSEMFLFWDFSRVTVAVGRVGWHLLKTVLAVFVRACAMLSAIAWNRHLLQQCHVRAAVF